VRDLIAVIHDQIAYSSQDRRGRSTLGLLTPAPAGTFGRAGA